MKKVSSKFVFLLGIVVLLVGVWAFKQYRSQAQKKNSELGQVEKGDFVQRITISGSVEPKRKTFITAPYRGYVKKIFIQQGQMVKSGDPVASVGTSLMVDDEVFPLRAPFSGKVVQVNKEDGEFIKESDPLDFIARIDDLSEMYIDSAVPEIDRLKLKIGQDAVVKASAILEQNYKAVVTQLSFAAKERDRWERSTTVEFPVRLKIQNVDGKIQSGMSVLIDIITLKKESVLMLRHEFIHQEDENYFVVTDKGDRKNIQLGAQNEEVAEVLSGIDEGQKVRRVNFADMVKE